MKKILASLALAAFLAAPAASMAGGDIDMSKVTCKEFLNAGDQGIGMMVTWIDGYLSAKSDNTVMSDEWMKKLGTHMGTYCAKNGSKTIMDAIDALPDN
ncbi:MAG: hypothetical protein IJU40_05655 [Desulfovibrionaceae bacterium]|nr:hypothetical protein [Desulfovibrionaceae bacterium]